MSNKQQLQINNTKYASLIETLRGKAIPSGEDVTTETNAYTTKLASLETAVAALETELAGKASGGSSDGNIETCILEIDTVTAINAVSYTTLDNDGNLIWERITNPSSLSLSLTAVCGTLVQVSCGEASDMTLSNASVVYNDICLKMFAINTNINGTATITLTQSSTTPAH